VWCAKKEDKEIWTQQFVSGGLCQEKGTGGGTEVGQLWCYMVAETEQLCGR